MSQFLAAELEIARTLTHIARISDDSSKKNRCIFCARKAYEAVEEFLPRSPLKDSENIQIKEALNSLKSQLEALGETFGEPLPTRVQLRRSELSKTEKPIKIPSLPRYTYADAVREVKRFLIECNRLRARSEKMRTQNNVIMQKKRCVVAAADPPHWHVT